jgi:hypothetical protein
MALLIIRKKAKLPEPDALVPDAPKAQYSEPHRIPPEGTRHNNPRFPGALPAQHRYLDGLCRAVLARHKNALVSWWLMAGYMYEVHDLPLISDGLFDEMSRSLAERYDEIDHPQKQLIDRDFTKSASGVKFPLSTRCAAQVLARQEWGVSIDANR